MRFDNTKIPLMVQISDLRLVVNILLFVQSFFYIPIHPR